MNATMTMEDFLAALTENFSAEDLLFSSISSDLATAIINKRVNMGLTQSQLAEMLNKSQTTISKWENADCNFTIKTLIEIAQKLDFDLSVELKSKTNYSIANYTADNSKIIKFPGHATSPKQSWRSYSSPDVELLEM